MFWHKNGNIFLCTSLYMIELLCPFLNVELQKLPLEHTLLSLLHRPFWNTTFQILNVSFKQVVGNCYSVKSFYQKAYACVTDTPTRRLPTWIAQHIFFSSLSIVPCNFANRTPKKALWAQCRVTMVDVTQTLNWDYTPQLAICLCIPNTSC